ncbi:kinase-like domain-containing protein [Trichoderma chlorosporum]
MGVEITKLTDLCCICEWTIESNGEQVPQTSFAIVDSEENAYHGHIEGMRSKQLTVEIARESLLPIPDEEIYPIFPPTGLTVAPDDCSGRHVKRTAWATYPDLKGTALLPKLMLQEAETMEFLAQHPHPNIVGYHGCRVKRGRIAGLVLETFPLNHDLAMATQRPESFRGLLDKDRIMTGLRAAVDHLHSMGLAHNDINPANIMLGEGGEAKLIDPGSCQPVGGRLMSCGTFGWCKEMFYTSETAHDEYGLELLGPWLEKLISSIE